MNVIRSLVIAFSTYSRIPMPPVEWSDENRRYAMCFFPMIGVVIGLLAWGWLALSDALNLNAVLRGVHEGSQNMVPTAVSQVTEGIGRVVCGLLLCGMVLRHWARILPYLPDGTTLPEAAAAAAILGVTLSTAVGLLTLLCFPKPHRGDAAPVYQPPSDRALRRALLRILIPVAAASLVTNLTTLIDLATGLRLLEHVILAAPASFGMKPDLMSCIKMPVNPIRPSTSCV